MYCKYGTLELFNNWCDYLILFLKALSSDIWTVVGHQIDMFLWVFLLKKLLIYEEDIINGFHSAFYGQSNLYIYMMVFLKLKCPDFVTWFFLIFIICKSVSPVNNVALINIFNRQIFSTIRFALSRCIKIKNVQ